MPQKLPVDGSKWIENTSHFSKDVRDNYNEVHVQLRNLPND